MYRLNIQWTIIVVDHFCGLFIALFKFSDLKFEDQIMILIYIGLHFLCHCFQLYNLWKCHNISVKLFTLKLNLQWRALPLKAVLMFTWDGRCEQLTHKLFQVILKIFKDVTKPIHVTRHKIKRSNDIINDGVTETNLTVGVWMWRLIGLFQLLDTKNMRYLHLSITRC